jgi:multiple antibiotic resistance protein
MLDLFVAAFVAFFVVINPAGVAVTFSGLSRDMDAGAKRATAITAVSVAAFVLVGFAVGGQWLLAQLGVDLHAFRVAGGALLFLIAVDMLFERRAQRRAATAGEVAQAREAGEQDDVSVFPLAIPLIAGPGAIATILLYVNENTDIIARGTVLAAAGLALLLTLGALLSTTQITRLMGAKVLMVLTRIFGIILAAMAAQFVIDGIRGAFGLAGG